MRIKTYIKIIGITFGVQVLGICLLLLGLFIGDHVWFNIYTMFNWLGFSIISMMPILGYLGAVVTGIVLSLKWGETKSQKLMYILLNPINILFPCLILYILSNWSSGLW